MVVVLRPAVGEPLGPVWERPTGLWAEAVVAHRVASILAGVMRGEAVRATFAGRCERPTGPGWGCSCSGAFGRGSHRSRAARAPSSCATSCDGSETISLPVRRGKEGRENVGINVTITFQYLDTVFDVLYRN